MTEQQHEQSTPDSGSPWDTINVVANTMHQIARDKGWYDPPKSFVEQIALWHSECSEALEEVRSGNPLPLTWYQVDTQKAHEAMSEILVKRREREYGDDEWVNELERVISKFHASQAAIEAFGPEAPEDGVPTPREMEVLVRAGIAKPEGFPVEAADVIIRIFDTCAANGVNIGDAIRLKAIYNKTRPHRHGGKIA